MKMVQIFKCSNYDVDALKIKDMLRKEDEEEFFNVNDRIMTLFLDGFIIFKIKMRKFVDRAATEPSLCTASPGGLDSTRYDSSAGRPGRRFARPDPVSFVSLVASRFEGVRGATR